MIVRHVSKYFDRSSRTSSESRASEIVVNPTRSANKTETNRRSAVGATRAGEATWDVAELDAWPVPSARAEPHSPQNFSPGSFDAPQVGHPTASAEPHSAQNFRPARFSAPQDPQIMCSPQRSGGGPLARGA